MDFTTKLALTVLVIVVGAPSLPITGGVSGTVLFAMIAGIWGIDWGGNK